jgi:hypothetical protein
VEDVIASRGDVILGEGCREFQGSQGTVDLFGGCGGVLERLNELLVDPVELLVLFVTAQDT